MLRGSLLGRGSVTRTGHCRKAALRIPRGSRAPLRVQNFVHRDVHRAATIEGLARDFAKAWVGVMQTGDAASSHIATLRGLADDSITVETAHPFGCSKTQGVEALKAKLVRDHRALASLLQPATTPPVQPILAAANEATDTAFCMVRLPFDDSTGSERLLLLKLDLLLDDTVRRVLAVTERGHAVDGLQIPAIKGNSPEGNDTTSRSSTEEEEEEERYRLRGDEEEQWGGTAGSQQVPGGGVPGPGHCTPVFPSHLLRPWVGASSDTGSPGRGAPSQRAHDTLDAWARARASASDEQDMMKRAGCGDGFLLMDAYGLLPRHCYEGGRPEGATATATTTSAVAAAAAASDGASKMDATQCALSRDQVGRMFAAIKEHYKVDVKVVDTAVCLNESAAFMHWVATYTGGSNGCFSVHGMEVDLLDPETGDLVASYQFRDTMDVAADMEGVMMLAAMQIC